MIETAKSRPRPKSNQASTSIGVAGSNPVASNLAQATNLPPPPLPAPLVQQPPQPGVNIFQQILDFLKLHLLDISL